MPEDLEPIEKVDRIQRSFYIDPKLYKQLKIRAIELGWTASDVINVAIDVWLNSDDATYVVGARPRTP